eukprot:5646949-Prymnesium_polylepis.1
MAERTDADGDEYSDELRRVLRRRADMHGRKHGCGYTARGYTDDCQFTLLGVHTFVRSVVVWRTLLRTSRILGAEGHKRQAGTHVYFLGPGCHAQKGAFPREAPTAGA